MRHKIYVPGLAAFLALSATAPASAQSRNPNPDVTEQTFTDADEVDGNRRTAYGDRIPARIRRPRTSLLRPRTTFVRELLASVEDT